MGSMVEVVVLLGFEMFGCVWLIEVVGIVGDVFENQMNVVFVELCVYLLGQFFKEVWLCIVEDGMDGIQLQVVEVEFFQLVECVVDKEFVYCVVVWFVIVDCFVLRCLMGGGKKLWGVVVQVVVFWIEVVIDYIE